MSPGGASLARSPYSALFMTRIWHVPWLIQTFFLNLPRMCASLRSPSKHMASSRPLPSILTTCAYSVCDESARVADGYRMMPHASRAYLGRLP